LLKTVLGYRVGIFIESCIPLSYRKRNPVVLLAVKVRKNFKRDIKKREGEISK